MIYLACSGVSSNIVALILYTCVLIPFLQIKLAVISIIRLALCPFQQQAKDEHQEGCCCCLPVARFEDVEKSSNGVGGKGGDEGEMVCSICLVEFEKEDLVSQLPKCKHLFHMGCIERWLGRSHFTCPLCRSLLLHDADHHHVFPCKMYYC